MTFSFGTIASEKSQYIQFVPVVKKSLIKYLYQDHSKNIKQKKVISSSTDALKCMKEIGIAAINYIQSGGKKTTVRLDEVVAILTRDLSVKAPSFKKQDVVLTIISALNS